METVSEYIYNDYETEDVELYAEQMIRERIARDEKRREQIEKALAKAEREIAESDKFDVILKNYDLENAKTDAYKLVSDYLKMI